MVIIVGSDVEEKAVLLKKLTAGFARRGLTVGVVLHRLRGSVNGDGEEVKKFSDAGAHQVMVTTGREPVLYNKQGGITPLQRVAARYFSSVDILLADGYHDPLPKVEVCLSDRAGSLRFRDDPDLKAVVFKTIKPESLVPVFTIEEIDKLAEFLLRSGAYGGQDADTQ